MWPLETWSLQVMWSKITGVAAFSDKTCENLQQEKVFQEPSLKK